MTFRHSTRAQLLARIRERYRTATGHEAGKCAAFLARASDAELRSAFAASAGQVTSLKGRLQAASAKLAALTQATGE